MDLLTIIIVILVLAWLLGMGIGFTAGGLIHILLVVVIVVVVIRLLRGERL